MGWQRPSSGYRIKASSFGKDGRAYRSKGFLSGSRPRSYKLPL